MDMQKKMVNLNIENAAQSNPFKNYNRKWVAYPDVLPNKTLVNYMTPKNSNALNIYQRTEDQLFVGGERRASKTSSLTSSIIVDNTTSNSSNSNSRAESAATLNELMINPIIKNIFLRPQIIEIGDLSRLTAKRGSAASALSSTTTPGAGADSSNKSCITCFNFDPLTTKSSSQSVGGSSSSQYHSASRRSLNVINKRVAESLLDSSKAKQAFDASITQSKLKSSSSSSGHLLEESGRKLSKEESPELADSMTNTMTTSRELVHSELSDSETYSEGFEKSSRLTSFTAKKSLDFKDNFSTVVKIDIKFKGAGGNERSSGGLELLKQPVNKSRLDSSTIDNNKPPLPPKEWNRNVLIMNQREKVIESLMKTTIQNSRPKSCSTVNEDQQLKQLQSNSRSFKVISPEENLISEKINSDYDERLVALSNNSSNNINKEKKLKEKKRAASSTPAVHRNNNGDLLISYSQERVVVAQADTGEFVKHRVVESSSSSSDDRTNLLIETEKRLEYGGGEARNNNDKIINNAVTTTTTTTPSTSSSDINTTYRFRSSSSYSKSSNKSFKSGCYFDAEDDDGDDEDVSPSRLSLIDKTDEFDTTTNANGLEDNEEEEDDDESTSSDDDENEEESRDGQIEETGSMNEVLAKYGLDYRSLFSTVYSRNEKGSQIKLMSPLILSLFANVPPTIRFVTHDDKVNELPDNIKRLLRWKIVSITPNIVRATIFRSNFLQSSNKNDWIGIWGSHMKPECFKSIKDYQKINHLPGSFQIGRKDRLCRNLGHAQAVYGKSEYNFVPLTFILPSDYNQLKAEFENANLKWIIKPPASARGQGIRVVNKLESMPKKRTCVVQKYLANPYLIDGLKFDLRIYVYVSSFDPLRIYIFQDGLTRFASKKYSLSSKNISDKYIHLTNFSINKTNKDYKANDDENACTGHKWSLKSLWTYLKKKGINTDKVWNNIVDLVIKTIIIADSHVNVLVKSNLKRKYSVHELFGFDVILDENLKPWIVEVNISPSLHSTSSLDVNVKGPMIADLLNIASFRIPNPKEIAKADGKKSYKKLPKLLLHDKSVLPQQLSNDEKAKHQYYIQRANDGDVLSTILNVLTPDDLRILIESEDELARSGQFERIFPAKDTRKYMKLFDTTRYYNLLLQEWISKYGNNREKGIAVINNYCMRKIHLQNPTDSAENQWSAEKVTSR